MKKHLSKLLFLVIGLSLAATASYLNAWSGPTSQQAIDNNGVPLGNVDAPINLSALFQEKAGGIQANDLSAVGVVANQFCLGTNCITDWSSAGGGSSVPAGAVAAFNLTTCPAGWILADGNNGTKDLRGSFVRGYGTSTAGTAASGAFGVFQDDDFESHSHSIHFPANGSYGSNGQVFGIQSLGGTYSRITDLTGGTETRPKNVALLFCQKDGTSSGGGSSSDEFSALKVANNVSSFPNNVVCKNGNNNLILRIEGIYGDSNPAQVVYKAQQDQYYLGYRKDNGQLVSTSGYNIGTCPTQLSLDGRTTQF